MLSLSPAKLLVVLVLALILLGPDKLPQVSRQLGAVWNQLRTFHQKIESEVRESMPDLPSTAEIARLTRSPLSFLNSPADISDEPLVADHGVDAVAGDELVSDPGAPNTPGARNGDTPVAEAPFVRWHSTPDEQPAFPLVSDDPSMN